MAKVPGTDETLELLVHSKTYPAASGDFFQAVSAGGVQPDGDFVRLHPVPFRFTDMSQEIRRWSLIRVRAYRDDEDNRPESWRLDPQAEIEPFSHFALDGWRWDWMKKTVHESSAAMEAKGLSSGCVQIEPLDFYWEPDEKEWTPSQMSVIRQDSFFRLWQDRPPLPDRVPWQFRLRYREKNTGIESDARVLAWDLYEGFRRERKSAASDEFALLAIAERVRKRISDPARTVFAILGTHAPPENWTISAIYDLPTEVIEEEKKLPKLF